MRVSVAPTPPSGVRGPKVFITYRREETAPHAGRLYDAMVAHFGEGNVFMDVDMAPGVDFVERIREAVAACHVLIVVMGPRWATVEDERGIARLADPEDFVRIEVETALRRPDVTPIPVLVSGARMPNRDDLPPELRAITRRNALELSDQRWRDDIGRLISTLDQLLAEMPVGGSESSPERSVATGKAAPGEIAPGAAETAPPSIVAAATSAKTKPAAPWAGGRRRQRWALLGVVAIAVIVAAVVLTADRGGGNGAAGGGGDTSANQETRDSQTLLNSLPASIRPSCREDRGAASWMVVPNAATAQTLCGNTSEYYLTFGLWRSSLEAQDWVGGARDPGTRDCEVSTTTAMNKILPRSRTGCQDKVEGEDQGIAMWWSEDGSRVAGWFAWPDHNQEAALQQWKRVVQGN
jgi:hypothetical protein